MREGGPHVPMSTAGPHAQVTEALPPLQMRVGVGRSQRRENQHRRLVMAAPSRCHLLHLRGTNSPPQRVPPEPLLASCSPQE